MVKRAYVKNILRTVRSTLSRFLAIFAIVGLGVGFLAGLMASPDDMRLSADRYLDENRLYDIKIMSTLGLTDGDLEAVTALPKIDTVMPAYDTDLVLIRDDGDTMTAQVHTIGEGESYVNKLVVLDGRLPADPGECAVAISKSFGENTGWLGRTLTQQPDEDGGLNEHMPETFTVVGVVKSPAYFSIEQEYTPVGDGTVDVEVYVNQSSFEQDYYTAFYLTVEGAENLNAFGSEYEALIDDLTGALEPFGEERSRVRFEEIKSDAEAELADARAEYEDAKAEAEEELADALQTLQEGEEEIAENEQKLADAQREIDDGWAELENGRIALENELAAARQQLNNGYAQVKNYQKQLDEGRAQLKAGREQILAGLTEAKANRAQLDAAGEELDTVKAQLDALAGMGMDVTEQLAQWEMNYAEYQGNKAAVEEAVQNLNEKLAEVEEQSAALEAQQAELTAQKKALDTNWSKMEQARTDGEAELAAAEQKLKDAETEYADGLQALEEAKIDLADGWAEYEDARKEADEEFSDAEAELADAQAEIDKLEPGEWLLFTRADNTSFSSYDGNAEKISAIATVFPLFFFLVSALVALTTMTRMVEEERGQIGTMKALGYSSGRIAAKYLIYAAAAGIAGSAVGLLIGMRLFPAIIIGAYNIMYDIPELVAPFHLSYALLASGSSVAVTLLATLSACWAALRENPARLMQPTAPKAGKRVFLERITPLWSRMKFTSKVTARNLIRYKKRFFMTVTGIAGCTALLVTGFGLRDSISDIVTLQFDDLSGYQVIIGITDEKALTDAEVTEILDDPANFTGYMAAMQNNGHVVPRDGNPADEVILYVPEGTAAFREFFRFRHRTDDNPVTFDEHAVIVSEKLAERQHLAVGSEITVKNQAGVQATLTITDICENYVYHYLYLSPALYEEFFGEAPAYNIILGALAEDVEREKLSTDLLSCEHIAIAQFTGDISENLSKSLQGIDSIVWVLILSAGALALVVLYNLTNINVSERQKELATIKVLGFYDSEVSAYIYRETAVLTLFGAVLGLVLGVFLHQFVIRTAEIDIVMFGRSIYPPSFVWSFLLTIVFSVLVNLVMHRKLKNISMVESMKAE